MPDDFHKEKEFVEESILKRGYGPIDPDQVIKRTYSPIGLTFESTDMGEPGEKPAVSSVRILTARPGSPIPECAGYELQDYIPNATFVESPGNAPISLGEFTDVYVFVRRSAAALK